MKSFDYRFINNKYMQDAKDIYHQQKLSTASRCAFRYPYPQQECHDEPMKAALEWVVMNQQFVKEYSLSSSTEFRHYMIMVTPQRKPVSKVDDFLTWMLSQLEHQTGLCHLKQEQIEESVKRKENFIKSKILQI